MASLALPAQRALAAAGVALGRAALWARHLAGGRALNLGWRNAVAAARAKRAERRPQLFQIDDLPAGGHSGILQRSEVAVSRRFSGCRLLRLEPPLTALSASGAQ